MDKEDLIFLAKIAIRKNCDYETFKYSDYLYGKEDLIDDVWDLVDECKKIGTDAFEAKYPVPASK